MLYTMINNHIYFVYTLFVIRRVFFFFLEFREKFLYGFVASCETEFRP